LFIQEYALARLWQRWGVEPVAIFGEILGVADVALTVSFFDLGGDSLTGAMVTARINKVFGTKISLREFVSDPISAILAAQIHKQMTLAERQHHVLAVLADFPWPDQCSDSLMAADGVGAGAFLPCSQYLRHCARASSEAAVPRESNWAYRSAQPARCGGLCALGA
jgi:acyl transferase domain-containing protein